MGEREPGLRRTYVVCFDNDRQATSVDSREELEKIVATEKIDWISSGRGKSLEQLELDTYAAYLKLRDSEKGTVPSNKSLARALSSGENQVSRSAIARARIGVARKLGYDKGW